MNDPTLLECLAWFTSTKIPRESSLVSATRDVFQARLDRFAGELIQKHKFPAQTAFLIAAITGEVGNNTFDHNLGRWMDVPGCWFGFSFSDSLLQICLADRGCGILKTLREASPDIKDDNAALEIAFTKRISGRFPERRGNGLKFVSSVINNNPNRGLICFSGRGSIMIGGVKQELKKIHDHLPQHESQGVMTYIYWKEER